MTNNRRISVVELVAGAILLVLIGLGFFLYTVVVHDISLTEVTSIPFLIFEPIPNTADQALILHYYTAFNLVAGVSLVVIGGPLAVFGVYNEAPYPEELVSSPLFPLLATVFGMFEEFAFRGIPLVIALFFPIDAFPLLIVGTVIWVLYHDVIQWPMVAVVAVFYLQLWAFGFWEWAVILHGVHNLVAGIVMFVSKR